MPQKIEFKTKQNVQFAILEGKSNKEITQKFNVSPGTITKIRKVLFDTPESEISDTRDRPCPNCQFADYNEFNNGCTAEVCDFMPKYDRTLKELPNQKVKDPYSWRFEIRASKLKDL